MTCGCASQDRVAAAAQHPSSCRLTTLHSSCPLKSERVDGMFLHLTRTRLASVCTSFGRNHLRSLIVVYVSSFFFKTWVLWNYTPHGSCIFQKLWRIVSKNLNTKSTTRNFQLPITLTFPFFNVLLTNEKFKLKTLWISFQIGKERSKPNEWINNLVFSITSRSIIETNFQNL